MMKQLPGAACKSLMQYTGRACSRDMITGKTALRIVQHKLTNSVQRLCRAEVAQHHMASAHQCDGVHSKSIYLQEPDHMIRLGQARVDMMDYQKDDAHVTSLNDICRKPSPCSCNAMQCTAASLHAPGGTGVRSGPTHLHHGDSSLQEAAEQGMTTVRGNRY